MNSRVLATFMNPRVWRAQWLLNPSYYNPKTPDEAWILVAWLKAARRGFVTILSGRELLPGERVFGGAVLFCSFFVFVSWFFGLDGSTCVWGLCGMEKGKGGVLFT